MSSDEIAIRLRDVSKHYLLFDRPQDRLKQSIVPRLQRLAGRKPKQYYRDFAALSHVSFEVRRGEKVGVIGRNGSGKSTLLQIVCGTLRPNGGAVEVNGRIAALLELGAGFNPEFTGRENVYLNAAILGLSRSEVDARFDEIARFASIGDFIEQPVKTYSSGMYVRLAFATAINVDPDILVVDEALAVGDEAFQRKCYARIEQIQERGGTILFVTHSGPLVVQLCSRALLFDGGELILDGRPKLVTSQYQRLVNASPEAARDIRAGIVAQRDALPAAPILAGGHPTDESRFRAAPATGLHHTAGSARDGVARMSGQAPAPPVNGAPAVLLHGDGTEAPDRSSLPLGDYYDPNLKPQSTVCLEERGARIRDLRITTLSGQQVNILQLGRRYVFEFHVDFSVDATEIGFGMWVRTVEGVGLGGAQTVFSQAQRTRKVCRGNSAHVKFEFSCILLPGVYFLSCGLFGTPGSDQIVMHRLIDALMFRVAPEPDLIATGRIDFGAQPTIVIT